MSKPSKEKAVCKTCQHMEPEIVRCGRNQFYCMHPEAPDHHTEPRKRDTNKDGAEVVSA